MSKETFSHLEALREEMRRLNVDAVIIPGTDPHQSEYICDHWKFRDSEHYIFIRIILL